MTIRCDSDQQVSAAAEVDTVAVRSPVAISSCVAEVHAHEIGIAGLAMLGPHSGANSENPRPSPEAVMGRCSAGRK